MVKCLPEFEYFTVFLKNKNIIFKIRRSKVTDYAALNKSDFHKSERVYRMKEWISIILSQYAISTSYKPSVHLMGHWQTVQNQIRCRKARRLIWFCTVCLRNVLVFVNKGSFSVKFVEFLQSAVS